MLDSNISRTWPPPAQDWTLANRPRVEASKTLTQRMAASLNVCACIFACVFDCLCVSMGMRSVSTCVLATRRPSSELVSPDSQKTHGGRPSSPNESADNERRILDATFTPSLSRSERASAHAIGVSDFPVSPAPFPPACVSAAAPPSPCGGGGVDPPSRCDSPMRSLRVHHFRQQDIAPASVAINRHGCLVACIPAPLLTCLVLRMLLTHTTLSDLCPFQFSLQSLSTHEHVPLKVSALELLARLFDERWQLRHVDGAEGLPKEANRASMSVLLHSHSTSASAPLSNHPGDLVPPATHSTAIIISRESLPTSHALASSLSAWVHLLFH